MASESAYTQKKEYFELMKKVGVTHSMKWSVAERLMKDETR